MKLSHWVWLGCVLVLACGDDDGMADDGGITSDGGARDSGTDGGGADAGSDGGDPCDTATCDTNASCSSASGAAVCTCNDGFVGDGATCTAEAFCSEGVCGVGTCDEEADGYSCTCPSGYADDGTTCADVDECTDTPTLCGPGACVNEPGGYACTCPAGYADDGTTCVDVDECTDTPTVCGAGTCANEAGGYACTCPAGYTDDGATCVDVDECTDTPTVCGVGTCANEPGGYACTCPSGYVDDGGTCVDVDECTDTPTVCGPGTCANQPGGYACTCPSGYRDDGTTCVDVDECMAGTDDCAAIATCTNTAGGFTCGCPSGYTGDGTTCEDVNECAAGTDTCTAAQLCFNTGGSFSCACRPGTRTDACLPLRVLIYDDTPTPTEANDAATSLGYAATLTTSRAAFQTAFDAGAFDLVIYDTPGLGLSSEDEGRLRGWVIGGGPLIFSAYNLQSFPSMQSVLGVSVNSYNTPRPVHRATGALVDLYAQFATVPNPIPTARDAGDNGDELTLTGAGLVLANLDSAGGPGAMVLTNGGRVLVNGFLPYDMDVPAMTEMYRNQINLVMNPVVLDYHDSNVDGAPMAARRIAWTAVSTTSGSAFAAAYDAGLRDLVVVDVPGSGIPSEVTTRLTSGIPAGDRVVFSWWQLDSSAPLQSLLQVSTVTFRTPRPVFPSPGAPVDFFSLSQSVPVPLTTRRDAGDNGDELTPVAADGFVAGRFTSTTGPGAIAVTRGERVVVNGFLPYDVGDANDDADLLRDMEELYENQFLYLFAP